MGSSLAVLSVAPDASALGITTSSAWAMKMFLPEPSYLICSVVASCSRCRVGSRFCGARSLFPEAGAEVRRAAGWEPLVEDGSFAVAVVLEAMVEDEGTNQ